MSKNTKTQTQAQNVNEAETAVQNVSFDGMVVKTILTVRRNRDAEPVKIEVELDYAGVPAQTIYAWANRTKIIDLQRALRGLSQVELEQLAAKGTLRRRATEAGLGFQSSDKAFERASALVGQLDEDARAALLAQLQAMN